MRKVLSLVLAILMIASVTVVAATAAGADTATVTITGFNNESSATATYAVGETLTAYVALNCKDASEKGMIASLKAFQYYDSDVLELADAFAAEDGMVEDLPGMFPVIGNSSTVANAKTPGVIKYNASTPGTTNAYKFNSDETMLIVTHYTVKAAGTATITNPIETLAKPDFYLTKIVSKGAVADGYADKFTVTVSLSEPAPPAGSVVSGTVTSFNSNTDEVSVQLLSGETVAYETTVTGNSASYSILGVEDGTYTLRVSKKDHVTRDYNVVVSGDTVQDATILLKGDYDGNGALSAFDYSMTNAHAKGVRLITDEYTLKVVDIDGSGTVTAFDASMINAHAKGIRYLW